MMHEQASECRYTWLMTNLALRLIAVLAMLWTVPALATKIAGRATVIDGDTIAVEGADFHVRLYGIDAPEGRQVCRDADGAGYLCGSRAALALDDILGRNARVSCRVKHRDRYRRYVAICRSGGRSVNHALVLAGWALDYPRYSRGIYARAEALAREHRRGMWVGGFQAPWEWRKQVGGG